MEKVSFKEVQKELELESLFLNREHNILDFKKKGDFLLNIGFNNSIATRIYNGITESNKKNNRL